MKPIEFTASFGDRGKKVNSQKPTAAGGGFQVFIDKYFKGMITNINGHWVAHLNDRSRSPLHRVNFGRIDRRG
ncbi:MAG: hypothetical protein WKF97_08290 [Chitinophagaceae bacterium]